jgi:hypothetical protein
LLGSWVVSAEVRAERYWYLTFSGRLFERAGTYYQRRSTVASGEPLERVALYIGRLSLRSRYGAARRAIATPLPPRRSVGADPPHPISEFDVSEFSLIVDIALLVQGFVPGGR